MLLSDELLSELQPEYGTDADSLFITQEESAKKRQKREEDKKQRKQQPNEEVKQMVKKLSKKKQKRFDQIQKRKERELKQSDYMQVIRENELSETERQLMTSTRQLNQNLTMKQLLSLLMKKEKAGIKLTEEERNILYKKRDTKEDVDFSTIFPAIDGESVSDIKTLTSSTEKDNVEEDVSSTLSFNDLFRKPQSTTASSCSSVEKSDKSKKNKRKQNDLSEPSVALMDAGADIVSLAPEDSNKQQQALNFIAHPSSPMRNRLLFPIKKSVKRKPLRSFPTSESSPRLESRTVKTSHDNHADTSSEDRIPAEASELRSVPVMKKSKLSKEEVPKKKSIGELMLEKFKKLKESNDEKQAIKDEQEAEELDEINLELNEKNAVENDDQAYSTKAVKVYEEIKLPINALGQIQSSISHPSSVTTTSKLNHFSSKIRFSVKRPPEIVSSRINLPVCQMEQEIVESITNHDVIILCGETGSGKSTQVPQFLYEYGYSKDGMIGIAQPRRVAVLATADRVNYEMGQKIISNEKERLVGYQIRYDSHSLSMEHTKIKFMTDGILLREITQDILLRDYSVVILDEAHERNINTDILLGMLSRAIPLRKQISVEEHRKFATLTEEEKTRYNPPITPLKLVIMSATIRVEDFQNPILFPTVLPPVIQVPSRQYPVITHFAKRTELKNYLKETYRKVCQIHTKLPSGGILVFLTGKQEILTLCRKLYRRFYPKQRKSTLLLKGEEGKKKKKGEKRKLGNESGGGGEEKGGDLWENDIESMINDAEGQKKKQVGSNDDLEETILKNDEQDEIEDSEYFFDNEGGGENDEEGDLDIDDEDEGRVEGEEGDNEDDDDISVDDPLHKDYFKMNTINEKQQSTNEKVGETDGEPSNGGSEDSQAVRKMMLSKLLGTDVTMNKPAMPALSGDSFSPSTALPSSFEEPPEQPPLKPLIYPLYAMMSPKLQERIFRSVPEGYRLIVVATNVAETSITIPNISYVVDSGRCKEKVHITSSTSASEEGKEDGTAVAVSGSVGITKYQVNWVSKASANQRQGRAGRTGIGHCYRLYSANFYHTYMKPFLPPEITTTPLEDVILQMVSLGIKEIHHFPFPTNPPKYLILNAIKLLQNIGALIPLSASLSSSSSSVLPTYMKFIHDKDAIQKLDELNLGNLSQIGKFMSFFPIHPRFSKILISTIYSFLLKEELSSSSSTSSSSGMMQSHYPAFLRIMGFVLTLVATLSEKSIFNIHQNSRFEEELGKRKKEKDDDDLDDGEEEEEEEESDLDEEEKEAELEEKKKKANSLYYNEKGDALAQLKGTGAYLITIKSLLKKNPELRKLITSKKSVDDSTSTKVTVETKEDDIKLTKGVLKRLASSPIFAEELTKFCSSYSLHELTLQRIVDLRNQLQGIAESLLPRIISSMKGPSSSSSSSSFSFTFPSPIAPPTTIEETIIRQLLLTGYCDQIAKKIPAGFIKFGNKRSRFTAYMSCHNMFYTKEMILKQKEKQQKSTFSQKQLNSLTKDTKESSLVPIYIHPSSNLFPSNPLSSKQPQYLLYQNIIMNSSQTTYYMTNVTIIEEKWISTILKDCPLLSYGEILSSPSPYYDEKVDMIYCSVQPKYGNPSMITLWELSTVNRPMIDILKKKYPFFGLQDKMDGKGSSSVQSLVGYRKEDEIYR
jgi:HrpA-like RNA helicase